MPLSGDGDHVMADIHTLANEIPYSQLYRMSRLRRLKEKWNYWRTMFTEEEIRAKLETRAEDSDEETLIEVDDRGDDPDGAESVESSAWSAEEGFTNEMIKKLQKEDNELVVLDTCELCHEDFAVVFDPHMDQYFCEECDKLIHVHGTRKSNKRVRLQAKTSPLAENGLPVTVSVWTVWKVAIIVILFLIYPSLTKEIALMLNCTESLCVDHTTCHKFLKVDARVDCDTSKYTVFQLLAFICFFFYGFGIPFAGFLLLKKEQQKLHTKEVLGTLGFLYSGFRKGTYYWEMIIMVRKMLVVFIVVFLDNYTHFQLYAAMWTLLFFTLLNIFTRPFKFKVLWSLENMSLMTISISLNLGLVYFEDPSKVVDYIMSGVLVLLNLLAVIMFVHAIVSEGRKELIHLIDEDGDGDVSCEELQAYASREWRKVKPKFFQTPTELDEGRQERDATTDAQKYPTRKERWVWLRDQQDKGVSPESRSRRNNFNEAEMNEWWGVSYGETLDRHPLVPPDDGADLVWPEHTESTHSLGILSADTMTQQ